MKGAALQRKAREGCYHTYATSWKEIQELEEAPLVFYFTEAVGQQVCMHVPRPLSVSTTSDLASIIQIRSVSRPFSRIFDFA